MKRDAAVEENELKYRLARLAGMQFFAYDVGAKKVAPGGTVTHDAGERLEEASLVISRKTIVACGGEPESALVQRSNELNAAKNPLMPQ